MRVPRRGRPAATGRRVPQRGRRVRGDAVQPLVGAPAGYTFAMKPNMANRFARKRWSRRCRPSSAASTSSASPNRSSRRTARRRSDPGAAARRRPTSRAPRRSSVDGAPRAEARRGRTGARAGSAARSDQAAWCRPTWKWSPAPTPAGARRDVLLPREARRAAVTGRDLRNARPDARREQPARRRLLAEPRRRGEVRQADRRERRQAARDRSSTAASQTRATIEGRINDEGRISGNFTQQEAADLSLTLRSGALPASLDLPRGAHGRPVARRRLDPRRRHGLGHRPRAGRRCSCSPTTSWRASTPSCRWS